MELQCGEYQAVSKKCKSNNLTVHKYLHVNYHNQRQPDLTVDQLNKIISIHGFKKLHKIKKEVLIDAVGSIELMDLTRSTLNDDNISSCAFITSQEATKDLMCLNWNECCVTSFKTLNSVNYDFTSLRKDNAIALKSKSIKKKPQKMRRLNEEIEPAGSLASGDQSAAKGNATDCVAAAAAAADDDDNLSSSSLLIEAGEERPKREKRASSRLEGYNLIV